MIDATLLRLFFVCSITYSVSAITYQCDPSAQCGCSTLSTVITSRIVGGEMASNHAWNWIVSFQNNKAHQCGASLLTPEYAVTAAHCVHDLAPDLPNLSIVAGTNFLDDSSSATVQRRAIIKMVMHPDYNNKLTLNDIAIIQFIPLNVSTDFKLGFICLPNENQDPFQTNASLVAIGWGATYFADFAPVSNYLQQVTVYANSSAPDDCVKSGAVNATTQFCAGISTGGKDTCQGDSGGPLMAFVDNKWVLAGITSTGEGCALAERPGVYTRVSRFIPFINSNVEFPKPQTTKSNKGTTVVTTRSYSNTTTQSSYNITDIKKNTGNIIDKSKTMSILSFLLLILSLFLL